MILLTLQQVQNFGVKVATHKLEYKKMVKHVEGYKWKMVKKYHLAVSILASCQQKNGHLTIDISKSVIKLIYFDYDL